MVPVVDLAIRFGRQARDNNIRTCIVIVDIEAPNGSQQMGVVVGALLALRVRSLVSSLKRTSKRVSNEEGC